MQPNVIMILIDDLGWMDLSCQGSSFYETPHIDQLRKEGMAFDQAYAACPVCSPSRASILSGKYPARLKVTDWIDHENYHPCRGQVNRCAIYQGAARSVSSRWRKRFRKPVIRPGMSENGIWEKKRRIRSITVLMSTSGQAGGAIRRKDISVHTTWKTSARGRKGNT